MDTNSLIKTNPQDHNPEYRMFRATDLPLVDLPVPEIAPNDTASAENLIEWHYKHNVSRAVCIVLHRAGYREIVAYDRMSAVILDRVVNGLKTSSSLLAASAIERGLLYKQNDGTLIPTAIGLRLYQILPPALRSPEPVFSGTAGEFVQAELAKLPALLDEILATEIEPCQTACPVCGGYVVQLSAEHGPFWHCEACSCDFPDADGKPQAPAECPLCHEIRLTRYASGKIPGAYYYHCRKCDEMFHDSNGQPGQPFERDPEQQVQ